VELQRWSPPPAPIAVPLVEVRAGAEEGLVAAMGADGDRVATRLARGCRALAVCMNDEVAAYGWISTAPEWIGEIRLLLSPGAGEAYVWNCVTLERHRQQGIFRALISQAAALLQAQGLRRAWIAAAGGPAVPALPAAGYRPVVEVAERRWGPLRRLLVRPAVEADAEAVVAARAALGLGASRFELVPSGRRH
jgi:GNAT superfamily N-acetyltransferase